RECGGLLPAERPGLREDAARVDVEELARRAVRVLADHAESLAIDVVARAAPLAFPAAQRGEDADLVSGLPAWIARCFDDSRPVGGDDARRRHSLRAVGEPQVEVIQRCGPDGDSDISRPGRGRRSLPDPDAGRPGRLLI